jgi:hypothetical protein
LKIKQVTVVSLVVSIFGEPTPPRLRRDIIICPSNCDAPLYLTRLPPSLDLHRRKALYTKVLLGTSVSVDNNILYIPLIANIQWPFDNIGLIVQEVDCVRPVNITPLHFLILYHLSLHPHPIN